MKIDIVSVFPEYFDVLNLSLFGKAQEKGLVTVTAHNLRDWTHDVHHSVDDTPAGGGAGMVLRVDTYLAALEKARCLAPDALVAALTPVGETLCQARVTALSRAGRDLIFLCGHYEGFDERILEEADLRLSVGDFVMTGGELPALSVMDAVARFVPGGSGKTGERRRGLFFRFPFWSILSTRGPFLMRGKKCRIFSYLEITKRLVPGAVRKNLKPRSSTVRIFFRQ